MKLFACGPFILQGGVVIILSSDINTSEASVTPGSVLRVLNISLCKQRNSSLTQRCASCGIRNSRPHVDRGGAGQGNTGGKIS